ncbi:MAG: hypothetical protein ACFHWX_08830 [Bacteroidota bacterium]
MMKLSTHYLNISLIGISLLSSCTNKTTLSDQEVVAFEQAKINGELVNEGYDRCQKLVNAWLDESDPESGLIPRNLTESRDIWNAYDAAADNYPFMVLTAALTNQEQFEGRMKDMLNTEIKLTSRIDHLPDTYSFTKNDFESDEINLDRILFGSSEYIKDGLLPLTEWLGPSPWSNRMIEILDDIWKYAPIETPYGNIPSENVELNGEMLQVLSRIYWMTGDDKYVDWAIRLGDYYLLDDHHPTQDFKELRLRDHGCEVVSGLCELYATVSYARPSKKGEYLTPIHQMLDRILEVGRNEDGLFYNIVAPGTGEIVNEGIADNFGYNLNGFYTVYLLDSKEAYKQATIKALKALIVNYQNFDWERGSADGYADAIEGALNLYNREPIEAAANWIDSEIQVMWSMQDSSHRENAQKWKNTGIIEGWHGDGNFARTTIMYNFWKTQGMTVHPWRADLKPGLVKVGDEFAISISTEDSWDGVLKFDSKRHETIMHLPFDWPRINQFPEWFTPDVNDMYALTDINTGETQNYTGQQLINGISVKVNKGTNEWLLKAI